MGTTKGLELKQQSDQFIINWTISTNTVTCTRHTFKNCCIAMRESTVSSRLVSTRIGCLQTDPFSETATGESNNEHCVACDPYENISVMVEPGTRKISCRHGGYYVPQRSAHPCESNAYCHGHSGSTLNRIQFFFFFSTSSISY
jgi:hypothetical protein